ncbi:MAG: phage tail protein [Thermosynechococcaceae cyanobacterium]
MGIKQRAQSMYQDPDPISNSRFGVELELDGANGTDGYFMECLGINHTQDVVEFCEVTPNKWGQKADKGQVVRTKLPGNVRSGNITLRRGLIKSMVIWDWLEDVEGGKWADKRKSFTLNFYNSDSTRVVELKFERAWPTGYKLGDTSAHDSEIAIEELEIAFEGFKRIEAGGLGDKAMGAGSRFMN